MSAYVIVESDIIDAEKLQQYSQQAGKTVKEFRGEFIAKGKAVKLAGPLEKSKGSIIRFDSREVAEAWYFSDAYQTLIPLRNQALNCTFWLVDGL